MLGENPTEKNVLKLPLHAELLSRWKYWIEKGVPKTETEELLTAYERKEGFEAPRLNAAIEAHLSESAKKRDWFREDAQRALGSALMAIGALLTEVMQSEDGIDQLFIIKSLSDAAKLITGTYHKQSVLRKATITPGFPQKTKELLKKAKAGEYLFGKDLLSQVKNATAIDKLATKIKPTTTRPLGPSGSKNASRPFGRRSFPGQSGYLSQSNPRIPFKQRQNVYKNQKIQHKPNQFSQRNKDFTPKNK